MNGDSYPYLYDIATERSHLFDGRSEIDIVFDPSTGIAIASGQQDRVLFRFEQEDGRWFLSPAKADVSLSVNQKLVDGKLLLQHLAIIQADERLLVFVEHEDSTTTSSYSANL